MQEKECKHVFDERPWGNYESLLIEKTFQVKRIEVKPGQRLSLQKHKHRAEKWVIVHGEGVVTVGDREVPVSTGSIVEIAKEEVHRMSNTGTKPLIFVETQIGDYLGEDDIVRLEDDYKRR